MQMASAHSLILYYELDVVSNSKFMFNRKSPRVPAIRAWMAELVMLEPIFTPARVWLEPTGISAKKSVYYSLIWYTGMPRQGWCCDVI